MSRHRDDMTLCYSKDNFPEFSDLQATCGRERPKHLIADFATCRGLDSESQLRIPDKTPVIEGYYTRAVEMDGKKYAVLEDFDTQKKHLVPFKEEYGQIKMFRAMQYDGTTLRYATDKIKPQSQKSLSLPGKELSGKER
jgi:hypothetical protein